MGCNWYVKVTVGDQATLMTKRHEPKMCDTVNRLPGAVTSRHLKHRSSSLVWQASWVSSTARVDCLKLSHSSLQWFDDFPCQVEHGNWEVNRCAYTILLFCCAHLLALLVVAFHILITHPPNNNIHNAYNISDSYVKPDMTTNALSFTLWTTTALVATIATTTVNTAVATPTSSIAATINNSTNKISTSTINCTFIEKSFYILTIF